MPAWSPINIYRFSSWARSTVIPLLILIHHKPIFSLPNGKPAQNDFLDEIWCDPSMKSVPYAKPLRELWHSNIVEFAFAAIDLVLSYMNGLRYLSLREHSRRQCVKWILTHQEEAGDWAGIFPPMHVGLLALSLEGYRIEDDVMRRELSAVERFAWLDHGGKRIQACLSPVWDTILMAIGLVDAGISGENDKLVRATDWVKERQLLGPEGDWRIYRSQLAPGGFSFEYFNTWYPDVDDTAAAILAFLKQTPGSLGSMPVIRAITWILGMQNKDGGWAAFDVDNDKLFLNRIPFSDMDSLCDPSSADVTGRILEAFGLFITTAESRKADVDSGLFGQIIAASWRAIDYLTFTQEPTGGWYGRWGSNYIYGTSNVLCGLQYFREMQEVHSMVPHAIAWLRKVQNVDGGFGETLDTYKNPECAGCGPSTASQTAWGLMALLAHLPPTDQAISRGVTWLVSSQTSVFEKGATWPEPRFTGTGFPRFFYLGYSLYPHYFPMMALGRYWKARTSG